MLGFLVLQAAPEGTMGGLTAFIPLILIILVIVFMIRNTTKKKLERNRKSEDKINRMIKEAQERRKI